MTSTGIGAVTEHLDDRAWDRFESGPSWVFAVLGTSRT